MLQVCHLQQVWATSDYEEGIVHYYMPEVSVLERRFNLA